MNRRSKIPHRLLILVALLIAWTPLAAGVETPLLVELQGDCTVRVVHDATPDASTGTLVFRAFRIIEGLSYPCDLTKTQVSSSLARGIATYRAHAELKPVTSVFVGRITRYPWIRSAWQEESRLDAREQLDADAFNALVSAPAIGGPFADAVRLNGLEPGGASCEKLMFHANGAPMDAMCWIVINEH